MNRKLFGISILSLLAVALILANVFTQAPTAVADEAVSNADYQAVTARTQGGGEALYILDNRTGMIAVFTVEPGKGLQVRRVRALADAFSRQ